MLRITGLGNPVNIPDSNLYLAYPANLMTHRNGPVALDSSTGVRLLHHRFLTRRLLLREAWR